MGSDFFVKAGSPPPFFSLKGGWAFLPPFSPRRELFF